jgi:chorismate mutase/prephenate dehydratase
MTTLQARKKAIEKLKLLRSEIDLIDTKLLELLQKRATFAKEVGKIKTEFSLPIVDLTREKQMLIGFINQVKPESELSLEAIVTIYTEIIKVCRAIQCNG